MEIIIDIPKGNEVLKRELIKSLQVDRTKAINNLSKSVYVKHQEPFQKEILNIDKAIKRLDN